jgi:diguanylate cyclase (GGDEF)-like protein
MPGDPQETALRLRLQLSRQRRVEALRQAVRQGLELAATDPLTGLYNRRYALARLDRIAQQAVETGVCYAVMILDIDRFKQVNDRYGHAAGDAVLLTVAGRLRAALRPSDLLARIGGEEFLVVLPDASLASARAVAERLRAAVSDTPVALPDGLGSVAVTLSAGLTLAAGNIALPLADPLPMTTGTDPLDGDRRPGIGAGHWPSRQDGGQIAAHCAAARDGAIGWHSHVAVPDSDAADRDGEPLPTGLAAPGPSGTLGTARPGTQTPTGSIAGPEIRPADPFSGSLHPPGQGVRAALARADAALLLAKAEGRNQITVSSAA